MFCAPHPVQRTVYSKLLENQALSAGQHLEVRSGFLLYFSKTFFAYEMVTNETSNCQFRVLAPLLQLICKLKKVCNHPSLVSTAETTQSEVRVAESGKLKVTAQLLQLYTGRGEKVVLVSNYTQV